MEQIQSTKIINDSVVESPPNSKISLHFSWQRSLLPYPSFLPYIAQTKVFDNLPPRCADLACFPTPPDTTFVERLSVVLSSRLLSFTSNLSPCFPSTACLSISAHFFRYTSQRFRVLAPSAYRSPVVTLLTVLSSAFPIQRLLLL